MSLIKKSLILYLFIIIIAIPNICASDVGIKGEDYTINITTSENGLLVEEQIMLNNSGVDPATIARLWIQQNVKDVEIQLKDSGDILEPIISGNTREINLSEKNLTVNPGEKVLISLKYTLPTNTENFEKRTFYDVSLLSINFNNEVLYQGESLKSNSYLKIRLYKPTEAPLSITYIVIIFVIVVVLITIVLLSLRKQRSKVKKSIVESKETLETKKTLLMSLLKDLEKQHRSKTIADDTYNKLKEEYKQQAVEVMKKLEAVK